MRVVVVLALMIWTVCAAAQDKTFPLVGTSGKRYSAVAKGLQISVEDGVVHAFAEVRVQDAPGRPVVWEFRFTGCESGRGSVFWNTRALTGQPVGGKTYWIYPARDFPSNFIAALCELTKSQWQSMLTRR